MATSPLTPIVSGKGLTNEWVDLYDVPTGKLGAGIDAVVLNNYTATSQSFSIRLLQSGVATDLNEIITDSNIRAFDNNLAPAMIGQALVTGGIIQAKASANDSINIQITATIIDS
jgi:hypothetical protein